MTAPRFAPSVPWRFTSRWYRLRTAAAVWLRPARSARQLREQQEDVRVLVFALGRAVGGDDDRPALRIIGGGRG